jgi:hypothetical protein
MKAGICCIENTTWMWRLRHLASDHDKNTNADDNRNDAKRDCDSSERTAVSTAAAAAAGCVGTALEDVSVLFGNNCELGDAKVCGQYDIRARCYRRCRFGGSVSGGSICRR